MTAGEFLEALDRISARFSTAQKESEKRMGAWIRDVEARSKESDDRVIAQLKENKSASEQGRKALGEGVAAVQKQLAEHGRQLDEISEWKDNRGPKIDALIKRYRELSSLATREGWRQKWLAQCAARRSAIKAFLKWAVPVAMGLIALWAWALETGRVAWGWWLRLFTHG